MFAPGQFGAPPPPRQHVPDDDEDETLSERLWGLTEMFPVPVQKLLGTVVDGTQWIACNGWTYGRKAAWLVSTTALIGFLPIAFEKERFDMAMESQKRQQQMLLGPGGGSPGAAGGGGGGSAVMGAIS